VDFQGTIRRWGVCLTLAQSYFDFNPPLNS
jgi:hypothetical protein